jgi:hypothetical protein
MQSWIIKKLEQLLETLVDPLWKWILALPWASRLAILVFCAATLALCLHWKNTQQFLDTGIRIVAVTLHGGDHSMPLSSYHLRRVEEGIARLDTSLQADLSISRDNPFGRELGPWTPAQVVVALKEISLRKPEKLAMYFHSQAVSMLLLERIPAN